MVQARNRGGASRILTTPLRKGAVQALDGWIWRQVAPDSPLSRLKSGLLVERAPTGVPILFLTSPRKFGKVSGRVLRCAWGRAAPARRFG